MKQQLRALFVVPLLAIGLLGVAALPTQADAKEYSDVVTDEQITLIRSRCTALKATLQRVHDSDLLLRYNRGVLYRVVSDQLMSPLNQRIASNQLDGSSLLKTTASYNTTYQRFFDAYKSYEDSLSRVLQTNCIDRPTTFYSQLQDARKKRDILQETSAKLVSLAKSYKSSFDTFKEATLTNSGSGQ